MAEIEINLSEYSMRDYNEAIYLLLSNLQGVNIVGKYPIESKNMDIYNGGTVVLQYDKNNTDIEKVLNFMLKYFNLSRSEV